MSDTSSNNNNSGKDNAKKDYHFGEVKVYDLEKIEQEVLKESVYLDVFAGSDLAFKEECQTLNQKEIAQKLASLKSYSFKYKTEDFKEHNFPSGTQFGFMAQEVAELFPNLVKKDEAGNSFVNYTQVIPLMLETIKDLNERLSALEKKLK